MRALFLLRVARSIVGLEVSNQRRKFSIFVLGFVYITEEKSKINFKAAESRNKSWMLRPWKQPLKAVSGLGQTLKEQQTSFSSFHLNSRSSCLFSRVLNCWIEFEKNILQIWKRSLFIRKSGLLSKQRIFFIELHNYSPDLSENKHNRL